MPNFEFSFEGLDELRKDMESCMQKYPDETIKGTYKMAGEFTKDVNSKMPSSYKTGKRAIPSEWHRSRETSSFTGYTVGVEIENTAPHWHLVENGHEVYADPHMYAALRAGKLDHSKRKLKASHKAGKGSKTTRLGWAPGKGYCAKTRDEWDSGIFADKCRKLMESILKGHNL